jgi:trigger factor
MLNVPDELLENYTKEMLKKKESVEALVNRAIEVKLIAAVKPAVTLDAQSISVEEFNKLFA